MKIYGVVWSRDLGATCSTPRMHELIVACETPHRWIVRQCGYIDKSSPVWCTSPEEALRMARGLKYREVAELEEDLAERQREFEALDGLEP